MFESSSVALLLLCYLSSRQQDGFYMVLKILILMLLVRIDDAQMFFTWQKVLLALLIHTFTSSTTSPHSLHLSVMLPSLVRFIMSCSASPFSVMGVMLLHPSWGPCSIPWGSSDQHRMNSSQLCSSIWCWVWERKARSSADSMSLSWV